MESIFGVPFSDLALDDLRGFLLSARDEGIRWEAKGPNPDEPDKPLDVRHVREAGCALANAIGGYIVIGPLQDKKTREWSLPGVKIKHPEPGTWIDDAIGALRPRPRIGDPHVWRLEDDRVAAIVEVEPVAVPPCMMPGGEIYERTSGKSVKVTDPLVLARLMDAGRVARERAEARTFRAIEQSEPWMENKSVNVRVALSAAAYEDDISARLFAGKTETEAMVNRLSDIISATLKPDRYYTQPTPITRQVRQDAHIFLTGHGTFQNDPNGGNHLWVVRPAWDGSVCVRCAGNEPGIGIELFFDDILIPAWRAAAQIVPLLGGYGPTHLAVEILDGFELHETDLGGPYAMQKALITRWLEDPAPDGGMIASIRRELLRAAGSSAWEPGETQS